MKLPILTEEAEQRVVAQWLDLHKICWFHVPNGSHKSKAAAGIFKALGLKAGVSDIIIIDPPPLFPDKVGAVIELKRKSGGKLSPLQVEWLEAFRARRWMAECKNGADEAIKFLEILGYGGKKY